MNLSRAVELSALIPAAGFSSRMHQYKPLLRLMDKPMVEVVIRLFQECGISDIVVVTGHNHSLLESIIEKAGARPVFNPDFKTGMLGSIQKGVVHVSRKSKGFFLLPVDIPAIRPATIQAMISAFQKGPENIIIPEFEQTPGHPPLIPAWLIPKIIDLSSNSNLGELLLCQKDHQIRQPVHDRGILMDADTKETYENLVEKYRNLNIPDKAECWSIIRSALPGETAIQAHLDLVADTALKLTCAIEKGLNQKKNSCPNLNKNLIQAAALLHDIKRKEKDHDRIGSRFIKNIGFPRVASIVAEHMTIEPTDRITEKEIVYFADKLCNGNRLEVDYAKRFAGKIKQTSTRAETRILKRYEATQQIHARIEAATGQSIQTILQ